MSLKFIYLKRHFTVQTEKIQAQLFTRVNVARPVYPNQESGMEVVLSLLSWVSVVSTSEPLPAKTPSSSSGWLQPDHQDSSAWRRRGKPLQLRELGTPFQSCVNALHEPENQQDAMMPSAASGIMFHKQVLSFHSNLVVGVYVFQFLPACGVWGTQLEWELEVYKQQIAECCLSKVPCGLKQAIGVLLSCWYRAGRCTALRLVVSSILTFKLSINI